MCGTSGAKGVDAGTWCRRLCSSLKRRQNNWRQAAAVADAGVAGTAPVRNTHRQIRFLPSLLFFLFLFSPATSVVGE